MNVSNYKISKRGVTHLKVKEFSYTWTIKNFKFIHRKSGQELRSPTFTTGDDEEFQWELWIYPQGYRSDLKDYTSLMLMLTSEAPEKRTYLIVSLVDKKEKENVYAEVNLNISEQLCDLKDRVFKDFVKRSVVYDGKNGLLHNGTDLVVKCTMYFEEDIIHQNLANNTHSIDKKRSDDFENLLENKKFSDAKLTVANKEFFVYKGILAVRSPVFAAMFEHDMRENNENSVDITDINPEVMQEVLYYIYTGKVKNMEVMVSDILIAANKYGLDGLVALCEEELINNLNVKNIGEMLILADRHQANDLKTHSIKFLTSHFEDVMNTEKFKTDMKSMSPLFLEVLHGILNQ